MLRRCALCTVKCALCTVKCAPNVVDNNVTTAVADRLLLMVPGSNLVFPLQVPLISVQRLLGQAVCCGVAGCGHQSVGILSLHSQCCLISLNRLFTATLKYRNSAQGVGIAVSIVATLLAGQPEGRGSTRWFIYDRDWFVCKEAALRSSCATLREWSHNLHPPSCSG